jgi:hypothetical protein
VDGPQGTAFEQEAAVRHAARACGFSSLVRASALRAGRLDQGLDEAKARGWTLVSMKGDWKVIFPFERK